MAMAASSSTPPPLPPPQQPPQPHGEDSPIPNLAAVVSVAVPPPSATLPSAQAQPVVTVAAAAAASRRLPPPCWSHDETVALIESYRDKWYSLRRGNLKASHWQDVADAVARRCPVASPPKTAVQCRHKMEKLRKRYRNELQKTLSVSSRRRSGAPAPSSSWVHFKTMHSMEKGPAPASAPTVDSGTDADDDDDDDDNGIPNNDDEDDDDDDLVAKHSFPYNRSVNSLTNGVGGSGVRSGGGRSANNLRIKFPGGSSTMPPPAGTGFRTKGHENPSPNYGSRVLRDFTGMRGGPGAPKRGLKREEDGSRAVAEMVDAVKMLGDGFVRMEQMKMEMARDIETMRMEMEMKRTEMILESQQRIVEAFAKGFSEKKKKPKRMPSPES